MRQKFEQIYQADKPKTREDVVGEKISEIEKRYDKPIDEVLRERGELLATIAKMVGSNFDMKVGFGEAGSGSFFVPEDKNVSEDERNSVTLDPLILLEFEGADEFVAAHEGAHRAITRTLEQVGLKPKKERERYAEKIGWGFIHNALEDPAVNDWVGGLYQRIGNIMDENYTGQFENEGSIMSTPQVQELINLLGYVPNFVRYGSEVMRFWHSGEYSADLPEEVKRALQNTQRSAQSFYGEIPYSYPTEKDVLEKAKTRWQIYEKGIWPFVQEMIEEDMLDEKLKQYMKDKLQKAMEQVEGENRGGGQPQADGGASLEEMMDEFGFDEEEKEEMKQKMEEAMERKKERQEKLKEGLQNGEMSQEDFEREMKEMQDSMPVDMKGMSGEMKKKIGEKLNTESKETQRQAQKTARQSMEKAEDRANENIKGKIGPEEESHKERRGHQGADEQENGRRAEKIAEEMREKKRQEEEFEKWRKEQESGRTAWEKALSEQAKTIDELYQLVEELFQKKKHPRWQKGFSAGGRLDLGAAMQYEADPRNYTRLWERKTVPEKYDYRFTLLNDQSGSMRSGNKAENDLTAKAIVAEVLSALGIQYEVLGFTDSFEDNIKIYKGFEEDLNENRERLMSGLSKIVSEGGGGTPTLNATRSASRGLALQKENTGNQAHFLFVITDGDPTDGEIEELKTLNNRLSEENGQVIIGMGIGNGISEENLMKAYGQDKYIYAQKPEEFPKKMAALLEAVFTQTQGAGK